VNFARLWFTNRVKFIDTNFVAQPTLSQSGGTIQAGYTLTITAPTTESGTRVCYTLDGTDPRASGGTISASATLAPGQAAIVLTNNATVVARSWNPNHTGFRGFGCPPLSSPWSGPVAASFYLPPAFQSAAVLPDGRVLIQIRFQPSSPCFLDTSTNLTSWSPLTNFLNSTGLFQFTTSAANHGSPMFFRARQ
jgi:hypothetical protein